MPKCMNYDELVEAFKDIDQRCGGSPWMLQDILEVLAIHPVLKVEEVVYCKDCKFAYINDFSMKRGEAVCGKWYREGRPAITEHHNFCFLGVRRDTK